LEGTPVKHSTAPVLLVDDHEDTRRLLVELLSLGGFEVVAACDAREALARVEADLKPCLVLLDLGLPDVSGVELCRWLRGRPDLAEVPIYAMSGFYHLRAEAFAAGCDGYLLKPVRPSELQGLLSEHCSFRRDVA
jgi:CheY-like chemotaxis protein